MGGGLQLTQRRASQRELLGVVQAVVLGLVLAAYALVCLSLSGRAYTADFVQFFASAQSLRAGESLYKPLRFDDYYPVQAGAGAGPEGDIHPNLNPPLLALLVAPLTPLGLARGYAIWSALSLVAGLCACALLWRGLRPPGQNATALLWLWLAFLVYFPTYTALTMGQVTMILFLVVAGAWLAARSGRDRLAGVLLGVAVSLKVFTALVVVYFALQRRWRAVAWSIGTMLCAALVTLPFAGAAAWREYFGVMQSVTWFGNSWNASYWAFFTRILGGSENVPLVNAPAIAQGVVILCSAATVAWFAYLTGRPSRLKPRPPQEPPGRYAAVSVEAEASTSIPNADRTSVEAEASTSIPNADRTSVEAEASTSISNAARTSVDAKASTSMTHTAGFDLGYGLTLAVMLLVSPLGWMYYFPLLLLPGYAVWLLTREGRLRPLRWGLIVAWGLSTIPTSMVRAADVNDPRSWFTSNSVYFYALVVFAIVLSAAAARTRGLKPACSIPDADPIRGAGSIG